MVRTAIAIGFAAISTYVLVSSFGLARPGGWPTAPALLPIILSSGLLVMAVTIGWKEYRTRSSAPLQASRKDDRSTRLAWMAAVAMTGGFYFILLRVLPFEVAAGAFLFGMLRFFWNKPGIIRPIVIAVLIPLTLAVIFQAVFHLPLPGNGSVVQSIRDWLALGV